MHGSDGATAPTLASAHTNTALTISEHLRRDFGEMENCRTNARLLGSIKHPERMGTLVLHFTTEDRMFPIHISRKHHSSNAVAVIECYLLLLGGERGATWLTRSLSNRNRRPDAVGSSINRIKHVKKVVGIYIA